MIYLLPSLALLTGCSLIARKAVVKGRIADLQSVPRIDPNDPNSCVATITTVDTADERTFDIKLKADSYAIHMGQCPHRIKCQKRPGPKSKLDNSIVIEGALSGSPRTYPINIDTGHSDYILVNDIHILENRLPVYGGPDGHGICCLPDLRIGELVLSNLLAHYYFRHTERQLFGLPIEKNKEIVMGVSLLQQFKYVAFDNVKREVEFSTAHSFSKPDQTAWSQYPLCIQTEPEGSPKIVVDMPVAGRAMKLMFDTGFEAALVTSEAVWKQTEARLHKTQRSMRKVFAPFAGGYIRSRTAVVQELPLGHRTVKDAYVCILPDDALIVDYIKDQAGLLGMQCFDDTIVVLDFEGNMMWVKND
jgi:hypothetical protein